MDSAPLPHPHLHPVGAQRCGCASFTGFVFFSSALLADMMEEARVLFPTSPRRARDQATVLEPTTGQGEGGTAASLCMAQLRSQCPGPPCQPGVSLQL